MHARVTKEDDVSVKKLVSSPTLDDEFFTHLRLTDPDDAEFVADLYSDPASICHIDLLSLRPSVDDQKKWIARYKAREAAGKDFFLIIRHQTKDFGAVRIHDFKGERRSFRWGTWMMKAERPSGLLAFTAI